MRAHAAPVRYAVGLVLATSLTACQQTPAGPTVTSVTIEGGDHALVQGESVELTAVVIADPGATEVVWETGDTSVASVAAIDADEALLTAEGPGATTVTVTSAHDPGKSDVIAVSVSEPGELLRTWQFGTTDADGPYGIAVDDAGDVYVGGGTFGLLGEAAFGGEDGFVRKYAPDGTVLWTDQFGTSANDGVLGIAMDPEGNVVVAGFTWGALTDDPNAGEADAFIRKYDADGEPLWTEQYGSSLTEVGYDVAVDAGGNVVVTGYTEGVLGSSNAGFSDAYVAAFEPDGDPRWLWQFGTSTLDAGQAVATDAAGNVYLAGFTLGVLPFLGNDGQPNDAFVGKFDGNGNQLWLRQFGSTDPDTTGAVAADAGGGVVVAGTTSGTIPGASSVGGSDMYVRRYDGEGEHSWTRQFGSPGSDEVQGMAIDASGSIVVVGNTVDALPGQTSQGMADVVVRKYASDGSHLWTRQFGTSEDDVAVAAAFGAEGEAYVTGRTSGALAAPFLGVTDGFVRVYGR